MKEEDLIQIKKTIHFALRNSKFKNDTGFVFEKIAQVSLDNIEKQLLIHSVVKSFYCQSDIEDDGKCDSQCNHCKEYYKPLEQ